MHQSKDDKLPANESEWGSIFLSSLHREERTLKELDLAAIQHVGTLSGANHDPAALVRSANYFVWRGAKATSEVLREYVRLCRTSSDQKYGLLNLNDDRAVLLCLVLYETPPDFSIPPREWVLGSNTIADHEVDRAEWERFPLALRGDVPFLIARGHPLDGFSLDELRWCDDAISRGVFRVVPLQPSIDLERAATKIVADLGVSLMRRLLGSSVTLDSVREDLLGQCMTAGGHAEGQAVRWSNSLQQFVAIR